MRTGIEDDLEGGSSPQFHRPFHRDKFLKEYGSQLYFMKVLALISTALFSFNWFLGLCTLTWASTVILGGLLSQLNRAEFYCISSLLLIEALRLAAATLFGNLVTRKLIYQSTLPTDIEYDDKRRHRILTIARSTDQIVQIVLLSISFFLSLKRFPSLPQQFLHNNSPSSLPSPNSTHFDGAYYALRVFYVLVILSATIAVVGLVLLSMILVPLFTTSFSLRSYYDYVVWRGMDKGLLSVTDFHFLSFAFKALADEYRRNLRAPVVFEIYRDLILYLYAHNRGFDAARIAMDSTDHCEQEAAANIVGLWAQNISGVGPSLLLQSRLLTKLADALDHQETGRAATCSFESLARTDPEGLLDVENGKGERLMLILSKCISKAVRAKKEDKALVFIKVLIQLLSSEAGKQEAEKMKKTLVEDLRRVFRGQGCKKRTVGVAGKALTLIMGAPPPPEEVDEWLRDPVPLEAEHILKDEEVYIKELLGQESLPMLWQRARVRDTTSSCPNLSSSNLVGLLFFFFSIPVFIVCFMKIEI